MKRLILFFTIVLFAIVLFGCEKHESHIFVKEVKSVFDDDFIHVEKSEFDKIVENPNAITVAIYYKYETDSWILINDLNNLKAITSINELGDVDVLLKGAPIDPAAFVKIVIK